MAARDERLGDLDHLAVVGVGLVELHHRELGVVTSADALVAKDAADLEDPLHAADDEALEVQLERDAQVELHVERVVVGDERAGMGTTRLHVQHRRLHLDVAAAVQRAPEAGDDLVADAERAPGLLVDDEIRVALAEAGVGVGEAVPLVGERAHRFRQQLEVLHLHAQLALASGHDRAVHAHPVAEVEVAQRLERFVADDGFGDEQLHFVVAVAHRGEDELAGVAHQHHAPGDGHLGLGFGAGIEGAVLRAVRRACWCDRTGRGTGCPQPLSSGRASATASTSPRSGRCR